LINIIEPFPICGFPLLRYAILVANTAFPMDTKKLEKNIFSIKMRLEDLLMHLLNLEYGKYG
jgi:hypothetical protein